MRACRRASRTTAARAVGNIPQLVQEGGRQVAIASAIEINHLGDTLAGIAMDEEARARRAAALAAFCIKGESVGVSREAHREIEPSAEPDAQRSIGASRCAASWPLPAPTFPS